MRCFLTLFVVVALVGCSRPTVEEVGELVDHLVSLSTRAAQASSASGSADSASPVDVACSGGGTMRFAAGEGGDDQLTLTNCSFEDWTIDGIAWEEGEQMLADLDVSTSTTSSWSCWMDYRGVYLPEFEIGGVAGTVCGYDWIDDLLCPPGLRDEGGYCDALRAEVQSESVFP